jgi:hypothetical protein
MTALTYFTVTGHWYDIESPDPAGSSNTPAINVVYAFVTFTARLKPGTQLNIAGYTRPDSTTGNTGLVPAPVTGRILDGELSTIDRADTPNLQLIANTPALGLSGPLTYDVAFTAVTYAEAAQTLLNFAFTAPTAAGTIDLCDPALERLKYDPTNYPAP